MEMERPECRIRKAEQRDLDAVLAIYESARAFMREHGNPLQWGGHWPPEEVVRQDIEDGLSYVLVNADDEPECVFYYRVGTDSTYDVIEDGAWIGGEPYGVVHRLASSGRLKGAGARCILWALEQCGHIRIDTHGDNTVMQSVMKKLGFTRCGIIHVDVDDMPRIAYEKLLP